MINPFDEIIKLLNKNKIQYQLIEHEPVYTSEQAARVRGLSLSEGAKSLLLKTDDRFILVVLPGDRKLNSKELKKHIKTRDLRFATPDEVVQIMGCEIGSCYPFGNIIGIDTMADIELGKNEYISFNPGLHNKTIRLKYADYQQIVEPTIVTVSQI